MVVAFQGYSDVERIGEGGFGTLYRATSDASGAVV
ncbi:MAG: hypothetical protein JWN99_3190, partial [Ilumatobacteraceae bacterium]|nr:hypothetical protein [Ilumatobacteraceae bacterium]